LDGIRAEGWGYPNPAYDTGNITFFAKIWLTSSLTTAPDYSETVVVALDGNGGTPPLVDTALPAAGSNPKFTALSCDAAVANPGSTLTFTATITNDAAVATGDFKVRLYYQRAIENVPTGSGHHMSTDVECAIASVNIPAGGSATVTFTAAMPYQASDSLDGIRAEGWGYPNPAYDTGNITFFGKIWLTTSLTTAPNYSSTVIVALPSAG
jgi:hypothetical protein